MKRLTLLTLSICLLAGLSLAAQDKSVVTLKGYVIDNKCAAEQDPAAMEEFAKNHPKSCTLNPECIASGLAIYADHQLFQFDQDSNAKVQKFLEQDGVFPYVEITAKKTPDNKLTLLSIKSAE